MKKEDEWIKEFDYLVINDVKFWFRCTLCLDKKYPSRGDPAMAMTFKIYKEGTGWIKWEDFKGTYFAEKLTDYIQNTINGQRAVYWTTNRGRKFD